MAVTRADLEAMDRDELVDAVNKLSEVVDEQSQRLDELEEQVIQERQARLDAIHSAGNDRAQIRRYFNEALEERDQQIDQLEEELDQVEDRLHRERSKVIRRVANIEDELGFEDQDVIALAEGGFDALRESELARLLEGGPEAVEKNPSATYYRAEILARNWIRWGKSKEKDGEIVERTLASKRDDLLTRLEDVRNEGLEWKQVYRAMQLVADLGPANISLTETSHGKTLTQRVPGSDGS